MGKKQALVYGRRAALAVAKARPDDIERVLYQEGMPNRDLAPLLKACSQRRRPYRAVSATELERASKSDHHEGVLVVTRLRKPIDFPEYLSHWSEHQNLAPKGAQTSANSRPSHKRNQQARNVAFRPGPGPGPKHGGPVGPRVRRGWRQSWGQVW